jgi:hypothetical protein
MARRPTADGRFARSSPAAMPVSTARGRCDLVSDRSSVRSRRAARYRPGGASPVGRPAAGGDDIGEQRRCELLSWFVGCGFIPPGGGGGDGVGVTMSVVGGGRQPRRQPTAAGEGDR